MRTSARKQDAAAALFAVLALFRHSTAAWWDRADAAQLLLTLVVFAHAVALFIAATLHCLWTVVDGGVLAPGLPGSLLMLALLACARVRCWLRWPAAALPSPARAGTAWSATSPCLRCSTP